MSSPLAAGFAAAALPPGPVSSSELRCPDPSHVDNLPSSHGARSQSGRAAGLGVKGGSCAREMLRGCCLNNIGNEHGAVLGAAVERECGGGGGG